MICVGGMGDGAYQGSGRGGGRSRWLAVAAAATLFGIVFGTSLWVWYQKRSGPPARFRLEQNILTVLDDNGRRLWTHEFDSVIDVPPSARSFQTRFVDLEGDGTPEFLIAPSEDGVLRSIFCFKSDGTLSWRLPLGRAIRNGRDEPIMSNYEAADVAVLKSARADAGCLMLLTHHRVSWTSRIAAITARGEVAGEYWHPGWLFDMTLADLNGDGIEEVIAGGVNNSFMEEGEGATLIVVDSRFVSGQGPIREGDHRSVQGVPRADQLAVLVFPPIPQPSGQEHIYTTVHSVEWVNGRLEVATRRDHEWHVRYTLDSHLRVLDIEPVQRVAQYMRLGNEPVRRREKIWKVLGNIDVRVNRLR